MEQKTNWPGFEHGIGFGGWLTNYKRINDFPPEIKYRLTKGDWEHFNTHIREEDVKYVAECGFDHIRLCFDEYVLEESPYVYRDSIFSLMDQFISWCRKYGLNCVLNLHRGYGNAHDEPSPQIHLVDSPEMQKRFIALWVACEKHWAHIPELVFEPMNEPTIVDPEKWNDFMESLIQAIRAINPTRRIVMDCVQWSLPYTLPQQRVWDDPNIIYSFHFYFPHSFTHQRCATMPDMRRYNRHMPYPGDIEYYRDFEHEINGNTNAYPEWKQMDKETLRNAMKPAIEFKKRHPDKILWLGEFGAITYAGLDYRINYFHDVIALAKEYGFPYCVWNFYAAPSSFTFSLADLETRHIKSKRFLNTLLGKDE